jgi:hypothetical protein
MRVDVANGQYTVIFENGQLRALRNGQEWPGKDLTGDNLVLCMAYEIEDLQDGETDLLADVRRLEERVVALERPQWRKELPDRIGMWAYRHDNYGFGIVRCDEVTEHPWNLTWFDAVPDGDWDGDWLLLEEDRK